MIETFVRLWCQTCVIAHDLSSLILDAVDNRGVLLVHDAVLPSVTALAVGEPVRGSWWSHPLANPIYNALGAIEDRVATVKLIRRKDTLVARRLWPDLTAVGLARADWQLRGLGPEAMSLLDQIESEDEPTVVDRSHREIAKELALRLLVYAEDVHTPSGHHVKAFWPWQSWMTRRDVQAILEGSQATRSFENAVADWTVSGPKLLPW